MRKQFTKDEIDKAVEMYKVGKSLSSIGRTINRDESSVRRKLNSLGMYKPTQTRKKWKQSEIDKAIRLYNKGYNQQEIANTLGRNKATVRKKLQALGVHKTKQKRLTQSEIDKMVKLYKDGESLSSIGRKLNIPLTTVSYKLQVLKIHKVVSVESISLWDVKHLRKYIIDVNEAKTVASQSGKRLKFKCPCGLEKEMRIQDLTRYGFYCPICSTNTSYPELFMIAVNQHFNLGYKYQVAYEHGRFDFINHKTKTIIEMNGMAHYKEITGTWENAHNRTKESDDKKRQWAKKNNYTLIFIDARKSEFEFIKENVNKEELLPNITDEDVSGLLEIMELNSHYDVRGIVEMYTIGRKTTVEIGKHYNVDNGVIGRILRKQSVELRTSGVQGKIVQCIETGEIYPSASEASRELGLKSSGNIASCANGKLKTASGYHWEWLDEIETKAYYHAEYRREHPTLSIELDDSISLDKSIDLTSQTEQMSLDL
ncbi:terminase gpP N-terminus-related DNA-binding protein [Staphylococcus xylosus]|uniref:terminase gpP N-terminus-related DNA-binding protein n=1 Tax=Staphylococcus xylosus TaxID=1288 RepID=UPI003F54D7A1